jgi:hypothetical protein
MLPITTRLMQATSAISMMCTHFTFHLYVGQSKVGDVWQVAFVACW